MSDTTLTSYKNFNNDRDPTENLTPFELKNFKPLAENKNIVI